LIEIIRVAGWLAGCPVVEIAEMMCEKSLVPVKKVNKMQTVKAYTAVGSRETPPDILTLMKRIGYRMAQLGYVGRSGGADGADSAFYEGYVVAKQHGCNKGNFEVYLPWEGFNGLSLNTPEMVNTKRKANYNDAREVASQIHPAWHRCTDGAKALHIRNVYQFWGHDLQSPSRVLICWAPLGQYAGTVKGGTNTAVQMARIAGTPVYNLLVDADKEKLLKLLGMGKYL